MHHEVKFKRRGSRGGGELANFLLLGLKPGKKIPEYLQKESHLISS